MLDYKYVFFLLKEEKLLVDWVQPLSEMEEDQLSSSGLFREMGHASLIEPQADFSKKSEECQLCGYSLL